MSRVLKNVAPGIVGAVAAAVSARALRWFGSRPTLAQVEEVADEVAKETDLSGFDAMVAPAERALGSVGVAASDASAGQVRLTVGDDYAAMVNQVHEDALTYARDRAAELVGKKWDGEALVDNPDAEMAITDTTRSKIRELVVKALSPQEGEEAFDLKAALEDLTDEFTGSPLFSRERAALIAQAEVGMAQSRGTFASLVKLQELTGLTVYKRWSTAHDDRVCLELCAVNALEGPIPLEQVFSSGHVAPLAHPRCRCTLVGVVHHEVQPKKELIA